MENNARQMVDRLLFPPDIANDDPAFLRFRPFFSLSMHPIENATLLFQTREEREKNTKCEQIKSWQTFINILSQCHACASVSVQNHIFH